MLREAAHGKKERAPGQKTRHSEQKKFARIGPRSLQEHIEEQEPPPRPRSREAPEVHTNEQSHEHPAEKTAQPPPLQPLYKSPEGEEHKEKTHALIDGAAQVIELKKRKEDGDNQCATARELARPAEPDHDDEEQNRCHKIHDGEHIERLIGDGTEEKTVRLLYESRLQSGEELLAAGDRHAEPVEFARKHLLHTREVTVFIRIEVHRNPLVLRTQNVHPVRHAHESTKEDCKTKYHSVPPLSRQIFLHRSSA